VDCGIGACTAFDASHLLVVVPLVLSNNPSATGKQQSDDLDPDAKILALKKEFQRKDRYRFTTGI